MKFKHAAAPFTHTGTFTHTTSLRKIKILLPTCYLVSSSCLVAHRASIERLHLIEEMKKWNHSIITESNIFL